MWYLWLTADDDQFRFEAGGVLNGNTAEAIAEAGRNCGALRRGASDTSNR
jgi:hypothetical protein